MDDEMVKKGLDALNSMGDAFVKKTSKIWKTLDIEKLIQDGVLTKQDGSLKIEDMALLPEKLQNRIRELAKAQNINLKDLKDKSINMIPKKFIRK